MVQYIHTPWRDRAELLKVRSQFYPSPPPPPLQPSMVADVPSNGGAATATTPKTDTEAAEAEQQHAVSRVSMWMQRGGCPHLVESTALLTAAILSDLHETRARVNSSSYAIRAAYSAAFSRFVTGLLDSQQDKQRKLSMYSVAKTIGLPATFVELRHQATHEQLPSLLKLRAAARKALAWIWHYYWKNLPDEDATASTPASACRDFLLQYLLAEEESQPQAAAKRSLHKKLRRWDESLLLRTLDEIGESAEDPKLLLRCLRLSRGILEGDIAAPPAVEAGTGKSRSARDANVVRAELRESVNELETMPVGNTKIPPQVLDHRTSSSPQTKGWSRYEGPWKPKPIGVV